MGPWCIGRQHVTGSATSVSAPAHYDIPCYVGRAACNGGGWSEQNSDPLGPSESFLATASNWILQFELANIRRSWSCWCKSIMSTETLHYCSNERTPLHHRHYRRYHRLRAVPLSTETFATKPEYAAVTIIKSFCLINSTCWSCITHQWSFMIAPLTLSPPSWSGFNVHYDGSNHYHHCWGSCTTNQQQRRCCTMLDFTYRHSRPCHLTLSHIEKVGCRICLYIWVTPFSCFSVWQSNGRTNAQKEGNLRGILSLSLHNLDLIVRQSVLAIMYFYRSQTRATNWSLVTVHTLDSSHLCIRCMTDKPFFGAATR